MAELANLSIKQLRERAAKLCVDRERVEAARDGDDPRNDLMELIRAAVGSSQRIRNPSCTLDGVPSSTLDDVELGAEPSSATFAPQPSRGSKIFVCCMAVLALLLSSAAVALVYGLVPLETPSSRQMDALEAELTLLENTTRLQQTELDTASQTIDRLGEELEQLRHDHDTTFQTHETVHQTVRASVGANRDEIDANAAAIEAELTLLGTELDRLQHDHGNTTRRDIDTLTAELTLHGAS
jgi:hypothetical protein